MRKCRFCHAEIQDTSRVCEHCGQDLFPGQPSAAVRDTQADAVDDEARSLIAQNRLSQVVTLLREKKGLSKADATAAYYKLYAEVQAASATTTRGAWYCAHCGTVGTPTTRTKGSFLVEVVLWLCMILPGLLYSLWRLTSREKVCPSCGALHMIPVDSPKARAALAK